MMKKAYEKPTVQVENSNSSVGSKERNVKRLRTAGEMILREVAGEYILIPVGEMALKVHGMISLSESGMLLWEKLRNGCSEMDLTEIILSEYDIDRETAVCDVHAFLGKLESRGVLIKEN